MDARIQDGLGRPALITLGAALVAGTLLVAAPAHAASNPVNTAIYATMEFLVYAEAGEEIDYDFTKVSGNDEAVIRIEGPGGVTDTCSVTVVGSQCFDAIAVAETGVWRFQYDTGDVLDAVNRGSTWDINVFDAGLIVPGRVWTEEYEMANRFYDTTVTFDFWYLGEFGDLYWTRYSDFNGVNSTFLASAVGLVQLSGEECVPQYRSSQRAEEINPADPNVPLRPLVAGECGGRYKIFFEEPDSTMPASATRWDGSTTWLYPPVTDPVLADVEFELGEPGTLTGELSFEVTDFQGALEIRVDVDGNGSTDDAVDRIIPYFVSATAAPHHQYAFDGRDGLGEPIPAESEITITVAIQRTGELHFVNTDAETRGGLQVESLRGPSAGNTLLYFDDRSLDGAVSAQKCSFTAVLDGRAGVDTSSEPAHGWTPCGDGPVNVAPTNRNNGFEGSWGDSRHIHDWTFRTADVSLSVTVVGEPAPPQLAATGANAVAPALAAGILLLGGLVFVAFRRVASAR